MFTIESSMKFVLAIAVSVSVIFVSGCESVRTDTGNIVTEPYLLDTALVSRSISFENPTGAPGQGGKAASHLGVGRKGRPAISLKPGKTVQLCDIKESGTIRHIWLASHRTATNFRSLVIRAFWDNQAHPSIECPIGDFMGFSHGKSRGYCSAAHSLGPEAGMNIWMPMPFTKCAKITLTNDGKIAVPLYYQIDYTINDRHSSNVGRLHTIFRRENPTTKKQDFVLMPKRTGKGRFLGAVIGVRNMHPDQWWGEGEVKFYMDGDTEFPTICGTGSEDYVGLSWGVQQTPYFYNGCSLNEKTFVSMYRWHLPDPIYWKESCRVTIQQISHKVGVGLGETSDDWSTATFWYESIPSQPLPSLPNVQARTKNLWTE